jgi:acyl CoA:acetate/3-ketoacid CoA transferase beta subunit
MADNPSFRLVSDPFGSGEEVGAVSALVPDVTILHGLAADEQGNILLSPPFGEGDLAAFAARKGVIATVERIVPTEVIRRNAHLMKVPGFRVLSVSEAVFGCHPYAIYNPTSEDIPAYVEDYDAFQAIRVASKSSATFSSWVKDWILDLDSHEEYLQKLGADRLNLLRGKAIGDAWLDDVPPAETARLAAIEGFDNREMMVVAAARAVEAKVRYEGRMIVEAGVGLANLAAWLAVTKLQQEDGIPAELVAEIGLYGYLPKGGEPFIFSNRNLPTCKSMTGVEAVLGLYVAGRNNNCIAIIGAGQIDQHGNINSTETSDGKFLLGSGGANDITSAAADTIAVTQQSPYRLVSKLPYITSPGRHVSTLVTDLGVYQKEEGAFVLTEYFSVEGKTREQTIETIRDRCGWELRVSDRLTMALPPSADQLLRLRMFDVRNDFLDYSAPSHDKEAK